MLPGSLLVALMIAHGTPLYCSPLFLHLAAEEEGWSAFAGSTGFSTVWIAAAITVPFAGAVIYRIGPRILMLAASLFLGAGFVFFALVRQPWQLVAALLVVGAGVATGGNLTTTAVLIAHTPKERRGRATGFLTLGISLAGVLILPVAERLCSTLGWRAAAAIIGLCMTAVLATISLTVIPARLHPQDDGGRAVVAGMAGGAGDGAAPGARVLRLGRLAFDADAVLRILLLATYFILLCSNCAVYAHLINNLTEVGLPVSQAAMSVSVFALLCIAGRFIGGWAADRWSVFPMLQISYLTQIVSLVLLASVKSLSMLAPFIVIYGLSTGIFMPLHPLGVAEIFGPLRFAREYGVISLGMTLGNAIGPMITGYLRDASGSYVLTNWVNAGLCVVSMALLGVIMVITGRENLKDTN